MSMSIYDVSPPTFPLTLGEPGRGRRLITIQHAPALREGEVLVAVRTDRTWKRRSGKIERHGPTRVIAEGMWAHGDAGNVAAGPDMLLAVRPGACWFYHGGDGVAWWGWCAADGTVREISKEQRESEPQTAAPFVRELVDLPDFPVVSKVRQWLAEHEAAYGAAAPPVPVIKSTSEQRAETIAAATRVLPLAAAVEAVKSSDEAARLTAEEESILGALSRMESVRRRILLGELAERVRL